MEKVIQIDRFVYIPVKLCNEEKYLEVFSKGKKIFEFKIPGINNGEKQDYYAKVDMRQVAGQTLTFKGDFSEDFFKAIVEVQSFDDLSQKVNGDKKPSVHFTPAYGWINDPNGLIYDGKTYQLYFQHNPFNVTWENMSWGHAKSKDLLHWQQSDDVMFPDERGMIFSGCGLIKDDKFLYPYTVAGTSTPWSDGKPFYQGLAISTDKGDTLDKCDEPFLGIVGKDSRDPAIFWHEETKAYIMSLYLEGTTFAIFRSKDLKDWQETQRFTLEKAWECPGLFKVPCQDGGYKWLFWSADGFYYWGDFDGYTFATDWTRHNAFGNERLYATQTYFGINDRIVAMHWLRMGEPLGTIYAGAMGIPREFSCKKQGDDYVLLQKPIRELFEQSKSCETKAAYEFDNDEAYIVHIDLDRKTDILDMQINGSQVVIDLANWQITIDGTTEDLRHYLDDEASAAPLPFDLTELELIADSNLLEVSFSDAMIAVYKIKGDKNEFIPRWGADGDIKGCGGRDRSDCHYSIKSIK